MICRLTIWYWPICRRRHAGQAAVALPGSDQAGVPPLYVWRMGSDGVLAAGLGPALEAVFLKDVPCS